MTGAFDNSPGRPGNPDPARRVHFGLQSWDEMFIGFFEAAPDDGSGVPGRKSAAVIVQPR